MLGGMEMLQPRMNRRGPEGGPTLAGGAEADAVGLVLRAALHEERRGGESPRGRDGGAAPLPPPSPNPTHMGGREFL